MIINEALNDECIVEHNRLRALHGCPTLTLDFNLAMKAQRYAEQLTEQLEHEQSNEYGENVAVRSSLGVAKLSGRQATLMWYSEIANYDFDIENQLACGHFSQVVWKSTTHAGFGVASSADGHKVYLVGVYMPPANFRDEWVENVPRPLSGEIFIPTREEISTLNCKIMIKQCVITAFHPVYIYKASVNSDGLFISYINEKVSNIPRSEATTDSQFTAATQMFNNARPPPTPNLYNGGVFSDFTREHPQPAKSECVLQESAVLELRPPWNSKCSKTVRIDEWFNCSSSDSGGMKSFERQTWYDVFTMEIIKPVAPDKISRSLHDKEKLDRMASEWAQKLRESGQLAYSEYKYNGQLMGENICDRLTVDGKITGQTLVGKWYEESKQYDYGHEPEATKTLGHFTQLVWRKTKELGVGFTASDTPGRALIVCFYHPPGNIKNEYMENVCPPLVNV
ncbi:hypothetical protein AHF37_00326 [Paragonimus kellicotti]|nr:hypothetical protein AHF37_00326 [Paragonimus kellicotti]